MRSLFALIAALGALASVALSASYGLDQATTLKDQIVTAFNYGMVAVFSFALHIGAVRAWVHGWRKTGVLACFVGLLLFLVTALLGTGGLASRADRVVSERQDAIDSKTDTKRQIEALVAEKTALKFTRAGNATVNAAQQLANTAKQARAGECERRGPVCRQKEEAEATAIKELAKAEENKAATDRANEIDRQLKRLRANKTEHGIGAADPLKALLASAIGAWADMLTAWQKLLVAFAYDLGLITMLILAEIMGHIEVPRGVKNELEETGIEAQPAAPVEHSLVPPLPRLVACNPENLVGSVKRILTESLETAKGARVEVAELASHYRAMCKAQGKRACSLEAFTAEVAAFCRAVGIKRKTEGEHLYLVDVQLVHLQGETAI